MEEIKYLSEYECTCSTLYDYHCLQCAKWLYRRLAPHAYLKGGQVTNRNKAMPKSSGPTINLLKLLNVWSWCSEHHLMITIRIQAYFSSRWRCNVHLIGTAELAYMSEMCIRPDYTKRPRYSIWQSYNRWLNIQCYHHRTGDTGKVIKEGHTSNGRSMLESVPNPARNYYKSNLAQENGLHLQKAPLWFSLSSSILSWGQTYMSCFTIIFRHRHHRCIKNECGRGAASEDQLEPIGKKQ